MFTKEVGALGLLGCSLCTPQPGCMSEVFDCPCSSACTDGTFKQYAQRAGESNRFTRAARNAR